MSAYGSVEAAGREIGNAIRDAGKQIALAIRAHLPNVPLPPDPETIEVHHYHDDDGDDAGGAELVRRIGQQYLDAMDGKDTR